MQLIAEMLEDKKIDKISSIIDSFISDLSLLEIIALEQIVKKQVITASNKAHKSKGYKNEN
jgi:hypothetical protein